MINLDRLKEMDNWFSESICKLCHELKYKCSCESKWCKDCEFSKLKQCADFLKEEYKESIYLSQFEYDLLVICRKSIDNEYKQGEYKLNDYWIIERMKEEGYYKNIDLNMTFNEILERYVIKE